MITKEDIERKDFEFTLSGSSAKLKFIRDLLKYGYGDIGLHSEELFTCGLMVDDVISDIDVVNEELYSNGFDTPPQPVTAPISDAGYSI